VAASEPVPAPAAAPAKPDASEVTEDQLKQQLVGKPIYLRGGYQGDSLSFNEHGLPVGHPAVGSYTLSAVLIDKVHISKHKVELEGARYALHFLGGLPGEDPTKSFDRVKITPKKKVLKITIDREQVVKAKTPKEEKAKKSAPKTAQKTTAKSSGKGPQTGDAPTALTANEIAEGATPAPIQAPSPDEATAPTPTAAAPAQTTAAAPAAAPADAPPAPAAEVKSEAPETEPAAEHAADPASVTTTTSTSHANQMLHEALDRVFAQTLDEPLRAKLPPFWQLYFQAQAAGVDYRPKDPAVLRSSAVDQQAKLLTAINPESNDFAQANGIAGRALYRVVVGADGKPGEIAVIRPIGFGLDENAVDAIRKATFQPATKGGQPAAEALDLAVMFRIYSKRTAAAAPQQAVDATPKPIKPGPYSVQQQAQQPPPAQEPPAQTPNQ
jgi:TonB family protein